MLYILLLGALKIHDSRRVSTLKVKSCLAIHCEYVSCYVPIPKLINDELAPFSSFKSGLGHNIM